MFSVFKWSLTPLVDDSWQSPRGTAHLPDSEPVRSCQQLSSPSPHPPASLAWRRLQGVLSLRCTVPSTWVMSLPDSALGRPLRKAGVVMALWAGGAPVRRRRETGAEAGLGLGRFSKDTRTSGMFLVGTSGRPGFYPWVRKIPWRREWLPTPVFWPGEFHRLCSPWGHKELETCTNFST